MVAAVFWPGVFFLILIGAVYFGGEFAVKRSWITHRAVGAAQAAAVIACLVWFIKFY